MEGNKENIKPSDKPNITDANYNNRRSAYRSKLNSKDIKQPKDETMKYYDVVYDEDKKFYFELFKETVFEEIATIYIYIYISVKMSESEYESESEYDEAEMMYSDIGKFEYFANCTSCQQVKNIQQILLSKCDALQSVKHCVTDFYGCDKCCKLRCLLDEYILPFT